MTTFKPYRETSQPGTLQPYSIYFIAPTSSPDYIEIYMTGASAATVKRVLTQTDIQALIDASMSSAGELTIVNDITARNALTPTSNITVLVLDASDDGTVTSGAATYVYRLSTTSWIKISEAESLDLALTWAALQDKPTSAVADIDDAVTKRHTHTNKTQLDKIGEDGDGYFTYNGALPVIAWSSTGW